MKYRIDYNTLQDEKALRKIAKEDLLAIRAAIEQKLTAAPDAFGKPMQFAFRGHRRLRVGDYRVIYRIEDNTVKIILIDHRSVIYRDA